MLLINGILLLVLATLYVGLVLLLVRLPGVEAGLSAHILATLIVVSAAIPLQARIRAWVGRRLRRNWPDNKELLRSLSAAVSQAADLDALRTLLADELPQRLGLTSATLWMLDPLDDHAFIALGRPRGQPGALLLSNGAGARQIHYTPQYLMVPFQPDVDWAPPFMAQGVRLAIPLRVGGRLIGIYGCGPTRSEGQYPPDMLVLLLALAPVIAGTLENMRAAATIDYLNTQLRTLDQLKDAFVESVGHELRTPLTSLSLAMQLLMRQPGIPPSLARITRASVAQLQVLVDRVLAFDERLELPQLDQNGTNGSVELAPLIEELVAEYLVAAEAKGLRFVLHVPSGLAAWGTPVRLHRALHEIVDNAVRYSEGGVVTLAASLQDGLAVISVGDEGPGIPEEERDRLFTAFYRGSGARALSETPGAGLGLSIARRDVESLGGQIWLERSGADGLVMCVALPVVMLSDEKNGEEQQERAVGV